MSYHKFESEDGGEYGSFEVFYTEGFGMNDDPIGAEGWYWRPCFPGCIPDSIPHGPFATEAEAIEDAQSN